MSFFCARGLKKQFGGVAVTNNISLNVHPNEIHAVIGPNGAGKSTLVNLLSGMLAAEQGQIELDGVNLTHLGPHSRVKHGLSRCFQLTSIFPNLSVLDNLQLAMQCHSGSSLRLFSKRTRDIKLQERSVELASRVGLRNDINCIAGTLPHGTQRKVDIALSLAASPKLLLLDEPLAGMGPGESERMVALISDLRADFAILLIEHDMSAVFKLADRISVLASGSVIAVGTPDEIRDNAEVQMVYLGTDAAQLS